MPACMQRLCGLAETPVLLAVCVKVIASLELVSCLVLKFEPDGWWIISDFVSQSTCLQCM